MTTCTNPGDLRDPVGHLADRLAALRWDALPVEVQQRVVAVLTDTVAVAALGSRRVDVRTVQAGLVDGTGPSTVIGRMAGSPVAAAAAANAAAITAHQLQDGHRGARGHPGSHVVPAVLAVAEANGCTGPALLLAVLAGYEAAVRVSLSMGGTRSGVHDIGSWGTVGSAVAVAHLLGGAEVAPIDAAIRGAAGLALITHAGTVFDGYGMQHLFLAEASRLGLDIGRAAAAGVTAHPDAMEHLERQVAPRWIGLAGGSADEPWRFEILQGYVKRHPTCAYLHGVNDAVAAILASHGGVVGHAVSATVGTFRQAAELPSAVPPRNALTARFNIPWTVATALTTGRLREDSFGDTALADPATLKLARRVTVVHDTALDARSRAGRPAQVVVQLDDGRSLTAEVTIPAGDGHIASDLVSSKAARLLSGRFGDPGSSAVIEAITRLSVQGARVNELTSALRDAASGADCSDVA